MKETWEQDFEQKKRKQYCDCDTENIIAHFGDERGD